MAEGPDERFVRYLSHWLVSLGCISVSSKLILPSKEHKFFTSCFVMEIEGRWCIVTAGHVLNKIDEYVKSWTNLTHRFVLYDSFGTFTTRVGLMEFDYREPVMREDRPSGLDFGAILLTPSEQATLRGHGVFAVEEPYWNQDLPPRFQEFALLGLPLQNMKLDNPGEAGFQPVYLRVEPTSDLPGDYKQHTDPVHYFKVMEPSRPDLDIEGMSGCPVFAFHKPIGSDDYKTIIFAMQNSWFKNRRVLAASSLRFAGNLLRQRLKP